MSLPAPWIEFDRVRQEKQYDTRAKRWVVSLNGKEETIETIKDNGPVLHGRRSDGVEVCFSPACVIRHYITKNRSY